MDPQIVIPNVEGRHNLSDYSVERLEQGKAYKDVSTIIICPTRGMISAKVVQSWMGLIKPMNQKVLGPIFMIGMEVGEAYSSGFNMIINNPELSKWKYVLTIEEDNMPPPDGLLKLYENMDKYDVIGGLYWTKGEGGQPMCYGEIGVEPLNFIPQIPKPDTIQPANGLGMGFNLFRLDMFKEGKIEQPWFKTINEYNPKTGVKMYTQDLQFFEKAGKAGYKFACDTRVKVGHYEVERDIIW